MPDPRAAVAALLTVASLLTVPAQPVAGALAEDPWVLSTTDPAAAAAAPAYVGNGYVGTRVPADGAGYAQAPVPTQTHVAGVYAAVPDRVHGGAQPEGSVSLPGWTQLDVEVAGQRYAAAQATSYRQALDLRRGVVRTTATWSAGGRVTDLSYDVTLDRSRRRVGIARLRITPRWSGTVTVRDLLGAGADLSLRPVAAQAQRTTSAVAVRAPGTGITVAVAARLTVPRGSTVTAEALHARVPLVQRTATIPVKANETYEVTKTAGFATSRDAANPLATARAAANAAPSPQTLLTDSARAWGQLWRADIALPGQPRLQRQVRAAMFFLLASVRATAADSLSPVGLSGGGYNNHIFWDAETWMYPALLAQHPAEAATVVDYRHATLPAARDNARRTGYRGARFAWESALTGAEVTPDWAETGRLEQHVTADVALAQWQHYLATGDRARLRAKGWPVLQGAVDFWASRATRDRTGWHIRDVEGPDEQNWPVDDSAYTNATAAATLRLASRAAAVVGTTPPRRWRAVADGLVIQNPQAGVRPEFRGYAGQRVKQADVVLLTYPWEHPQPAAVDRANLAYYTPRYDPDGPAMTDSVNAIVAAQLGGDCSAWTYTRRSVDPFVRAPYEQFTEARGGQGVFTFLTGAGGFLQEFLYGYPGLRWRAGALRLDPALPPQLPGGLTVTGLRWRGRVFDVAVRPAGTTLTQRDGPRTTVETPRGTRAVAVGTPIVLPTRTLNGRNAASCRPVTASAADVSAPAAAAVDGSPVTAWTPASDPPAPSELTVTLARPTSISGATATWLRARPLAAYRVDVREPDGRWRAVATVASRAALTDRIAFAAVRADAVRLRLPATRFGGADPGLAELTVS